MKLILKENLNGEYTHTSLDRGVFKGVTITENYSVHHDNKSMTITFEAKDSRGFLVGYATKVFKGNDTDTGSETSYVKAMFHFKDGDQTPQGLTDYYLANGSFPALADIEFDEWGSPNYQRISSYFNGGTISNPEIEPNSEIVYAWILENIKLNGEKLGVQFQFDI
jgi:hypothetical protein